MKTFYTVSALLCALVVSAQDEPTDQFPGLADSLIGSSSSTSPDSSTSDITDQFPGLADSLVGNSTSSNSSRTTSRPSGALSTGSSGLGSLRSGSVDSSTSSTLGCKNDQSTFQIFADFDQDATNNVKRDSLFPRQSSDSGGDGLPSPGGPCGDLYMSLSSSNLTDQQQRTCEIVSNYQFQCDINGGQNNAITKTGFAICNDNELSVNGMSDWWFCKTRDPVDGHVYWNMYEQDLKVEGVDGGVPKQCTKGKIRAVACTASSSSSAGASSLSSGGQNQNAKSGSMDSNLDSMGSGSMDSLSGPSGLDSLLSQPSNTKSAPLPTDTSLSGLDDIESLSDEMSKRAVTPMQQKAKERQGNLGKRKAFPLEKLGKMSWPLLQR